MIEPRAPLESRARRRPRWPLVLALVAPLAIGAAWFLRDATPPLTAAALDAARERWRRSELPDYDLRLTKRVDALAPETVVTQVRGRAVTRLQVGVAEVAPGEAYSIPGLFQTAERELEMAEGKEEVRGQPRGVVLRARFDEATGAPLALKRLATVGSSYVIVVERLEIPGKGVVWPRD